MNILTGVAVLLLITIVAFMYYRQTENFVVVGKFVEPVPENRGMDFTQQPVDKTYIFSDSIPNTASSFDRILSRFVDKTAPAAVSKTTFPESAPYNDTEVERISKMVLDRVKGPDTPTLDFISVEYAAKGVDSAKNLHYDLTIICHDRVKNYSLKLVIVCVLDPKSKLWVKKFASFNGFSQDTKGPLGVESVEEIVSTDFVPDFTSFKSLYV